MSNKLPDNPKPTDYDELIAKFDKYIANMLDVSGATLQDLQAAKEVIFYSQHGVSFATYNRLAIAALFLVKTLTEDDSRDVLRVFIEQIIRAANTKKLPPEHILADLVLALAERANYDCDCKEPLFDNSFFQSLDDTLDDDLILTDDDFIPSKSWLGDEDESDNDNQGGESDNA